MDEEQQDKANREKYWEELSDSEKIERTRQEVKKLQKTVDRMFSIIYNLRNHSHNDKQILVPMNFGDNYNNNPKLNRNNDEYF